MEKKEYALKYEFFIRNTFKCQRGEDPAKLADADIYNLAHEKEYLNKVKTGLAYTIARRSSDYVNSKQLHDPDDYERLERLLDDSLNVIDIQGIIDVLDKATNLFYELESRVDN